MAEDNEKWFNPMRDIQEVDQTGYVDLVKAYTNGSIPSDLNIREESYNGIEEPDSILGTPSDVFEAAQLRETVSSYTPPSNNPTGE